MKNYSPWRAALPALIVGPFTYLVTVAVLSFQYGRA